MKNQPFALIGINSDGSREALEEKLEENGINWRNAVDGGTDGPIATEWNVMGWPTLYVIDASGVIRFKDARQEELDRAVESLLEEMKKE